MTVVNIDTTNPDNFQARKPIPAGKYVFEIANDLVVTAAKPPSTNNIIKVELRCADEGEHKGRVVFDNIVLTKKAEFKLCHLALAAGTQTKDEMSSGIDLELFKGQMVEVEVSLEPPRKDPVTGVIYDESNRVKRYIFTPEDERAEAQAEAASV